MSNYYTEKEIENLAADEWVNYYKNGGEEDDDRLISTTLSCFCTSEYVKHGNDAAEFKYQNSKGEDIQTCSEIFSDRATVGLIAMATSTLIVLVNFILKTMLVDMIRSLRLKTVTAETNYTMISIFIGQFVNTAILLVLNNANFKDFDEGVGPLSAVFFVGTETDFSVKWYKTVGTTLMRTMFSQAIWPLIEFVMFYSILNFSRFLDRNFTSDTFTSSMPSVQAYIDLYAGPQYLIHYRYAMILLQICVAFMYGTSMPYLYFIACFAFVILYINERLLVCYYYREPPAFDEKMTTLTLDLTTYIPYIMMPFAFWALGNRQIFETVADEINAKSDIRLSEHTISNAVTHLNPLHMTYNSPPMICLVILLIYSILARCFCAANEEDDDDQLVEGLDDYYEALKANDKEQALG